MTTLGHARMGDGSASGVRHRHRRLLEAFQALESEVRRPEGGVGSDRTVLRAIVALLRTGLGHAAREEERVVPPGPIRETIAFEHAFLQCEIDALGRTIERAARHPRLDADIDRRLHRIGALLEHHVTRGEDDTAGLASAP